MVWLITWYDERRGCKDRLDLIPNSLFIIRGFFSRGFGPALSFLSEPGSGMLIKNGKSNCLCLNLGPQWAEKLDPGFHKNERGSTSLLSLSDRYVFGTRVVQLLSQLQKVLHQFSHALNTCSVESFLRLGTLHPEMSVHEKGVDFYIG